jgi:hypothetical protein
MKICPKIKGKNLYDKFSVEIKFHKIDPWPSSMKQGTTLSTASPADKEAM